MPCYSWPLEYLPLVDALQKNIVDKSIVPNKLFNHMTARLGVT